MVGRYGELAGTGLFYVCRHDWRRKPLVPTTTTMAIKAILWYKVMLFISIRWQNRKSFGNRDVGLLCLCGEGKPHIRLYGTSPHG